MRTTIWTLWVVTLGLGTGAIGLAGHRAAAARSVAAIELAHLARVTDDARQLADLRGTPAQAHARPASGLAAHITSSLAASGLPPSTMESLSPETPIPGGVPGSTRQRAMLVLASLTLPQVGTFLRTWREAEPAWTVVGVEISPMQAGRAEPGADLPLHAAISLEAVFMDDSGGHP